MREKWERQYYNRITTLEQASKVAALTAEEKEGIEGCSQSLPMVITPYYASLIDRDDPRCPVRRQAIPTSRELAAASDKSVDPLAEDTHSPGSCLTQNYPDRVLLVTTNDCAVYCRHCSRRRNARKDSPSREQVIEAIRYVESNHLIRDVVVSGGDPLTLDDERLEEILHGLRSIPHVEIIRLGTRTPVTMPQRVTASLAKMIRRYQPVFVNTHFNCPEEITDESRSAVSKLVDAGIPVNNQSVLLRGINDSFEIIKQLNQELLKARVRPYYLYQCDDVRGIQHFRTSVDEGVKIIEQLQGFTSGLAVPMLCIYLPDGGGKVLESPRYRVARSGNHLVYRNYLGKLYQYCDGGG